MFITFFVVVSIPDKKQFEGRRLIFGLQLEGTPSVMAGKAWQQALKANVHTTSTVRKQRDAG